MHLSEFRWSSLILLALTALVFFSVGSDQLPTQGLGAELLAVAAIVSLGMVLKFFLMDNGDVIAGTCFHVRCPTCHEKLALPVCKSEQLAIMVRLAGGDPSVGSNRDWDCKKCGADWVHALRASPRGKLYAKTYKDRYWIPPDPTAAGEGSISQVSDTLPRREKVAKS